MIELLDTVFLPALPKIIHWIFEIFYLFSNYCLTVSYVTWGFVFLLYRQVFSCCLGMNILSAFSYSQYQRMLSTLSQCEFSMGKTLLVYDMNLREMENYEKIYKDIGKDEKILFVFFCCCCCWLFLFHEETRGSSGERNIYIWWVIYFFLNSTHDYLVSLSSTCTILINKNILNLLKCM